MTGDIGGAYYGSLYTPVEPGSKGGGIGGGKGGGTVKIDVGGIFLLDGIITVDGDDGVSDSGGGSGGSIWITAGNTIDIVCSVVC